MIDTAFLPINSRGLPIPFAVDDDDKVISLNKGDVCKILMQFPINVRLEIFSMVGIVNEEQNNE